MSSIGLSLVIDDILIAMNSIVVQATDVNSVMNGSVETELLRLCIEYRLLAPVDLSG